MLNGKELVQKGIITNVPNENIQQHGIDLNLTAISRSIGRGMVFKDKKTILGENESIEVDSRTGMWDLPIGTYNVVFDQGCKIPNDQMLLIRQRSSLLRNGAIIHSSVFDAGFETKNIGTVLIVTIPIMIEYGSRIAQIYNHICSPVDNLYDGQFQQDKQRKQ